jgi:hypothetical protein
LVNKPHENRVVTFKEKFLENAFKKLIVVHIIVELCDDYPG